MSTATRMASLAGTVIALIFAAPAFAQDHPTPLTPEQRAARFERFDADEDGRLTRAEYVAQLTRSQLPEQAKATILKQTWPLLDDQNKGWITEEEFIRNWPKTRPDKWVRQ